MSNTRYRYFKTLPTADMDWLRYNRMGRLLNSHGTLPFIFENAFATLNSLQATGYNFGGLLTARIALGAFEAAFAPGVTLYMCPWAFLASVYTS